MEKLAEWGEPTCEVFNTFVDVFQSKLLTLLYDVGEFFLWAVAPALDGRKLGFDWLKPMWENHGEWPNVTRRFPTLNKLKAEVEHNIAK